MKRILFAALIVQCIPAISYAQSSVTISTAEQLTDPVAVASQVPCDTISDAALGNFRRNGSWFGIPIYQWSDQVFASFSERAVFCLNQHKTGKVSPTTGPKEMKNFIRSVQMGNRFEIESAIRKEQVKSAKGMEAARLLAAAQVEGLSSSELASRIKSLSRASTADLVGETRARQFEIEVSKLKSRLDQIVRDETASWEKDRPAREAKAASDAAEIARIEKANRERAEYLEGERTRIAKREQLKLEAAKIEQQQNALNESEKRAATIEEELKKPLSCENLGLRLGAAQNDLGKQHLELVNSAMMGDRKTICQGTNAMRATIIPLYEMAVHCRNVAIGSDLNKSLRGLNELAVQHQCP